LLRDAEKQFNAAMATFEKAHDATATVSAAPRLFSAGLQSEDFEDFKVCCRMCHSFWQDRYIDMLNYVQLIDEWLSMTKMVQENMFCKNSCEIGQFFLAEVLSPSVTTSHSSTNH